MTDATHLTTANHDLRGRFDGFLDTLVRFAAFDRTRQDLVRLSQTDDIDLATRNVSRDVLVRRIIGARGMF